MNQPNWTEIVVMSATIASVFLIPGVVGIVMMIRRQDRMEGKLDSFVEKHGGHERAIDDHETRLRNLEQKRT